MFAGDSGQGEATHTLAAAPNQRDSVSHADYAQGSEHMNLAHGRTRKITVVRAWGERVG